VNVTASQQLTFGFDDAMPDTGSTRMDSDMFLEIETDVSHELENTTNSSRHRRMQADQNSGSSTSVTRNLKLVDTKFLDPASIKALHQQWENKDGLITLSSEEWEAQLEAFVLAEVEAENDAAGTELASHVTEEMAGSNAKEEDITEEDDDDESPERRLAKYRQLSCRRRRRTPPVRRRRIPTSLRAKVTQSEWRKTLESSSFFEASVQLFEGKVLGIPVKVDAAYVATAEVEGQGMCIQKVGVMKAIKESCHRLELGLRVLGTRISALSFDLRGEKDNTEPFQVSKDWFRQCIVIYFLELCVTAGGTFGITTFDGTITTTGGRIPWRGQATVWAAGTIGVWIAEAGVRAMGTLLDVGLIPSFSMPKMPTVCARLDYVVNALSVEYGYVWRARELRYNRRRRWWGSVSFNFGAWKYINIPENPLRIVLGESSEPANILEVCTNAGFLAGAISALPECRR